MVNFISNTGRSTLKSPAQLFQRTKPSIQKNSLLTSPVDSFQRSDFGKFVLPPRGFLSPLRLFQTSHFQSEVLMIKGLQTSIHWGQKYQSSNSPRIPTGYGRIRGRLPRGLSQVASHILKKGNPLGTYTPFTLDGKDYIALNEYHTRYADPIKEAARQKTGRSKIYAVTVFRKL